MIAYFAEKELARIYLPRKDKELFDRYRNEGYEIYYQENDSADVVLVATPDRYVIPYNELP